VLLFAFGLLLATFRSIVIAAKAIVLNLLSVGAAYGVLVAVFQWGWGESLLGFTSNGGIANWLPMFTFVILFGLSMDYHVFILSRIREAHDRGLSTDRAISHGIKSTAGTVTSAAFVMVGVFAVFTMLPLVDLKEMAVAVLIDATIVRGVLLPSELGSERRRASSVKVRQCAGGHPWSGHSHAPRSQRSTPVMTTRTSKFIPIALALAMLAPSAASAAIPDPQSDAAMRKAIRDYAKYGVKDKKVKATNLKVRCVQATKIGSTRPCSGTFSLTLAGRTANYKLTSKADTFRNSPGSIVSNLHATATKKAPGLPKTVKGGSILQ